MRRLAPLGPFAPQKKALLIGINYKQTSNELFGCINDVQEIKSLLTKKFRFLNSNITVITDDTTTKPTRSNILNSLTNFIKSGRAGDQLYFHYSGHGSQVIDRNRDEKDGRDECLVPLDYSTSGLITDDELRNLLNQLVVGVSLFGVLDCCNSGSGFDLRYVIDSPVNGRYNQYQDVKYTPTRGDVVLLSGCRDNGYSYDAWDEKNRKPAGALTMALREVLSRNIRPTYQVMLKNVQSFMVKNGFADQVPQLSFGKGFLLSHLFYLW